MGVLESFSSFWASAYKEVIVFTAIIPVLLWRSLGRRHAEDGRMSWRILWPLPALALCLVLPWLPGCRRSG